MISVGDHKTAEPTEDQRRDCASALMTDDLADRDRERIMLNYIYAHGDEAMEDVMQDMVEAYKACGFIAVG